MVSGGSPFKDVQYSEETNKSNRRLKGFEIPETESESRCGGLRMGEREETGKEWSVGNESEDSKTKKLGVD